MTQFKILMNPQPVSQTDTVAEVVARCPFSKGMVMGEEVVTNVAVICIYGLYYWSVLADTPNPIPSPTVFDPLSLGQFIEAASWPQLKLFCADLVVRLHGAMEELDSEFRWVNSGLQQNPAARTDTRRIDG